MLSITTKFGTVCLDTNARVITTASGITIEVIKDDYLVRRILQVLGVEHINIGCKSYTYIAYNDGYARLGVIDGKIINKPVDGESYSTISVEEYGGNTYPTTSISVYPENFDINIKYN